MRKKALTTSYYSLERILSYGCKYNVIFGERKNGKTFSVKGKILEGIQEFGNEFAFVYVRRRHNMVVRRKMEELFADINDKTIEMFDDFIKYENGNFTLNGEVVGYKTTVEDAYVDKALTFGAKKHVYVLFDEFIDKTYFDDEIAYFQQCMGNIIRNEEVQDVTIFMLGNTVSKHCPYFDFFGIDITTIKQGKIYTLHNMEGGSVALEYCASKVTDLNKKKTSEYFGFSHPSSQMIMHGEWEYNLCNTKDVDGISWKSKRRICDFYITALKNVYEVSISSGKNPVAFVRKINTQNGIVRKECRYNLSFDNSLNLIRSDLSIVPKYNRVSRMFMTENVISDIEIITECVNVGRVVYQSLECGNDFNLALGKII